ATICASSKVTDRLNATDPATLTASPQRVFKSRCYFCSSTNGCADHLPTAASTTVRTLNIAQTADSKPPTTAPTRPSRTSSICSPPRDGATSLLESSCLGRVERAHHTLQDRLVKELRLAGISNIEAANAFLPAFVQTYNARFAKPPARDRDLHRPIAGMNDLDDILCWREQRSVSRQLVVNYNRMKFMLRPDKTPAALAGKVVDIYDFPDGRLE